MDTIVAAGTDGDRSGSGRKRGPYRRHSLEEKRRIVEETLTGDASVSAVARRHDMNTNQLFTWRQQYARGRLGPVAVAGTSTLLAVRVEEPAIRAPRPATVTAPIPQVGWIEIECARGYRVRVHGPVDRGALQTVLEIVASR